MSFFSDSLKELNDKMRNQKQRILLIIDQCRVQIIKLIPDKDIPKNIAAKFIPENCTSKLQTLDLGVLKSVKHW